MQHDNAVLERCYHDCKSYFASHAGAFFMDEAQIDDIFQEALIHLWREIETRRIELRDGVICRWHDGELNPMNCSLRTFMLAIAKRKHWELLRRESHLVLTDDTAVLDNLGSSRHADSEAEASEAEEVRAQIVTDAILAMSDRCRQILTLFYYEHRSLDEILALRPENTSKVGLKTSKYKCMQRLRERVRQNFTRLHLSI